MNAVDDVLHDLNPEDCEVFLAVEAKLSFAQASERLGVSETAVRQRFFRACLVMQRTAAGKERAQRVMQRMREAA